MPELIVYDKRNKRIHRNSAVKYRGMRAIVTELVDTTNIKVRTGGIIQSVKACQVEVL